MRNQFFYTRTEPIQPKSSDAAGAVMKYKNFTDSFNMDKVIRSVGNDDGSILVLLDDIHERTQQVPAYNAKGKQTGMKNQKGVFQSEIILKGKDVERFNNFTNIEK